MTDNNKAEVNVELNDSEVKGSINSNITNYINSKFFPNRVTDSKDNKSFDKSYYNEDLSKINDEKLPWHQNVAELLSLVDRQYHIDKCNDWYSQAQCFVSQYGIDDERIVIYCPVNEPTAEQMRAIYSFIQNNVAEVKKITVVVEKGDDTKQLYTEESSFQITKRYKQELLNNLVDFRAYYTYLKSKYYKDSINKSRTTKLHDIYVAVSGQVEQYDSSKNEIKSVESYILDWVNKEDSNKHLAVLGEYGQGKSVLSLKVALEMIEHNYQRIPIIIELRGQSPRNLSLSGMINIWAEAYDISAKSLLKLHKEGRLLLIFEGFDEMDLAVNAEMRFDHFKSLWQFARYDKAKVMFTGRPNLFLDDIELKRALNIYQPISPDTAHMQAIYLSNLSKSQIAESLNNAELDTKQDILELIDRKNGTKTSFYELVSRPSILFLVSCIWNREKLKENKERINSAIVIGEFIQSNYERQEKKQYENTDNIYKMPLSTAERGYFMTGIAVAMLQKNGDTNQLTSEQLVEFIEKLSVDCPDIESTMDGGTYIEPLQERINRNKSQGLEAIKNDIHTCGILVRDMTKNNHWQFSHKAYFEYLVSEFYVSSLKEIADINKQQIYQKIESNLRTFHKINYSVTMYNFMAELLAYHFHDKKQELNELEILEKIIGSKRRAYYLLAVFDNLHKIVGLIVVIITSIIVSLRWTETADILERFNVVGYSAIGVVTVSSIGIVACTLISFLVIIKYSISKKKTLSMLVTLTLLTMIIPIIFLIIKATTVQLTIVTSFSMALLILVLVKISLLMKQDTLLGLVQDTFGHKLKVYYLTCKEMEINEIDISKILGSQLKATVLYSLLKQRS